MFLGSCSQHWGLHWVRKQQLYNNGQYIQISSEISTKSRNESWSICIPALASEGGDQTWVRRLQQKLILVPWKKQTNKKQQQTRPNVKKIKQINNVTFFSCYNASILSWPSTSNPLVLCCYYEAAFKSQPNSEDAVVATVLSKLYVMCTFQEEKNPDHFQPSLVKGCSNHYCDLLLTTIRSVSATLDGGHPTNPSGSSIKTSQLIACDNTTCFCYKHCFHEGFVNCWKNDCTRIPLLPLTTSFNNLHEHKACRLQDSISGAPRWLYMFITWDSRLRHNSPGSVQVLDLLWLQSNAH